MKKFLLVFLGLVLFSVSSCNFIGFGRGPSHARLAAQLRSERKFDQAIAEYHKHISARLSDTEREPEENPYFYLILIGDIYLEQKNTERALESYVEAKDREVETPLVVDRIRRVARHLKEEGKYREAVTLLQKFRDLDEFVFDLDIDENLKSIVHAEDQKSWR